MAAGNASNTSGWGVVWSEEESASLIQICNEEHIQQQLSTMHKNIKI